jgi:type I restriction-modification system, M subunit
VYFGALKIRGGQKSFGQIRLCFVFLAGFDCFCHTKSITPTQIMTSIKQREELHATIWKIANDVRGAVDGWDFKQYVLGTLFYRFISEHFTNYVEAGDKSIGYARMSDDKITPEIKDDLIKTKGYFIYPSQLFVNVARTANTNENLNTELAAIFNAIESSAQGKASEKNIRGLFADFDTTSNRLGNTVADKNRRLAAVIKGVESLDFGDFADNEIDLFGDAYEFLISNYAANAGKSGGEFFTPQSVSKLIARLALLGQDTINKVYDPACGSGSLLLQVEKTFGEHHIEDGFYGQEINHTTYNLARMNMFLHGIGYEKFNIALGDTLLDPQHGAEKPFDAIVSNPPYSVSWIGSTDPTLINDPRFAPAGVLAPDSKADFAFVLHALSYLSARGRAAIVCFPGIFYRGGAEQKIRRYLVENNFVECVIAMPPNLFFGTSIGVCVLVLSKHKSDTTTRFIDASGEEFFRKETNNNVLTDQHIERIIDLFSSQDEVEHVATSVDKQIIAENGFNLSVNTYVEAKDKREVIDIAKLNEEIAQTVSRIATLRTDIDAIIKEIEG